MYINVMFNSYSEGEEMLIRSCVHVTGDYFTNVLGVYVRGDRWPGQILKLSLGQDFW